jgi:hypothetical protein
MRGWRLETVGTCTGEKGSEEENPKSGSGMKQGQEVLGGRKRQEVEKT